MTLMNVDIAALLANSLSADRNVRDDATLQMSMMAQENYAEYSLLLCRQLADEQAMDNIRMAAGLAFKNTLFSKDYATKKAQAARWLATDANVKAQIKKTALLSLKTKRKLVGNIVGQVIAAIAEVELPLQQWPELVGILLEHVRNTDTVIKQTTLQAIGYICEGTDPQVLANQSNEILSAVVQGAQKTEEDPEVRMAALRALLNSLEFVKSNFEREGERNFIMQVICEATQSSSTGVQAVAFECLVRIMQLYYDKMSLYMEKALFALTVTGMNHPDEKVALQAIEFWATVCEEELAIKEELNEAAERDEEIELVTLHFAERALKDVAPVLLSLMPKKDEDDDESEWNVSMSAASCLSLFALCVGNMIIGPVLPFVGMNIQKEHWASREVAIMAFGSILDGPDEVVMAPLVDQALPTLINMMNETTVCVKDTVAWTLSRICELLPICIKPSVHLHDLVTAFVNGLRDSPRIVNNCCWALMNLAEQLGSPIGSEAASSTLSMYFDGIITALMQFTESATENENNCRTSGYEAASTLVTYSADDCIAGVQKVSLIVLDRLENSMAVTNQLVGADERAEHAELQSSLLGLLTSCIRRLSHNIASTADRIMMVLLQLLNSLSKNSTITEDAFLAVGALTNALEAGFGRYAEAFTPILYESLRNPVDHQLCMVAIGLIGDICRALGENAEQFCPSFMQVLLPHLQNPAVPHPVKAAVLSCFGEIALAIGDKFDQYLELVMLVLQHAGSLYVEQDGFEHVDYVNLIYESNVEAYIGIVQGFQGSQKIGLLLPYMPGVFDFLGAVAQYPNRSDALTRGMAGLMGDLAEAFSGQLKLYLQAEWVYLFLREAKMSRQSMPDTIVTARWAKQAIKRACL